MRSLGTISSPHVGMKINEWNRHIQKFNVTDAEMLKAEIERDIDIMEEEPRPLDLLSAHCISPSAYDRLCDSI